MYISYNEFRNLLTRHVQEGEDFYRSLLETVIDNPLRYCGLFRLSNAKTKLIQNVTQSKEIKFGDLIEEMTTEYIDKLGYQNLDKHLGQDENGDDLNADQHFKDSSETIYLVEMKIRDDHDSTKKRGQYTNFKKKISLLRQINPTNHIDASMWFVDDSMHKNKRYYLNQIASENFEDVSLHLYYGSEFFSKLVNGDDAWNELTQILGRYRIENSNNDIEVPDFGTSRQILNALVSLERKYWRRLMSNKPQFIRLRNELFASGDNIERATRIREERGIQ